MLRSLLFTVGCAALAVVGYLFGKCNMTALAWVLIFIGAVLVAVGISY